MGGTHCFADDDFIRPQMCWLRRCRAFRVARVPRMGGGVDDLLFPARIPSVRERSVSPRCSHQAKNRTHARV